MYVKSLHCTIIFFKYISVKLEIKKENNFQHQVVEVLEIVLGCVEDNIEWQDNEQDNPDTWLSFGFVFFSFDSFVDMLVFEENSY